MHSRLTVRLAAASLVLASCTAAQAAKPTGEEHVYKTVGERKLRLYVTRPDGWQAGDKRPAIVFYHGGGWVGGAPGQFTEHSKYFASRGLVCVQVEYRLLDKKSSDPPKVCVNDAKSAMRWVRGRADKLGVDPDRIASGGGSAGGHLAAFVGMVEGGGDQQDDKTIAAKSNAMLLFNPVFDNGPDGWGHGRVGDDYQQYSPFHNVTSDDPPAIVFLGSEDALIPVKTADQFKAKMQKAGVPCEVMIFDGMAHGFFNYGKHDGQPYYETVVACDRFLNKLGWLEGEPTLEKP
ncbi:MAG: alpha/beta hydrolase [Pirellulaceae bacterium]